MYIFISMTRRRTRSPVCLAIRAALGCLVREVSINTLVLFYARQADAMVASYHDTNVGRMAPTAKTLHGPSGYGVAFCGYVITSGSVSESMPLAASSVV